MANYENTVDATLIAYDDQDNVIENSGKNSTILGGSGDDSIINESLATSALINGGEGNNTVENKAASVTITSGAGNDSIQNEARHVSISSGAGNDYVNNDSNNDVTIDGGDGNNTIDSYGNNVSIIVGAGKDFISIENGNNVSITSGAGDDTVIFTNGAEALIDVGEGNNSVENGADNVTIISGTGNNTITNNDSYVLFQYGGGNDVIYGFNETSTLQIASGSIASAFTNIDIEGNGDATLTIGSNTVVLKSLGTVDTINVMDASGEVEPFNISILITGTKDADTIYNNNTGAIIQALGGNDLIYNNTSVGSAASINAGANDDFIDNIADNVTINGGDGADSINNKGNYANLFGDAGDDYIYNDGLSAIIDGGAGVDSIDNRGDRALIYGGLGNDFIENYGISATIVGDAGIDFISNTAENVSISGGAGDDTITNNPNSTNVSIDGGEGADSIENNSDNALINGGAGNDYIYNYYGNNVSIDAGAGDDTVENIGGTVLINISEGNNSVENSNGDNVSIISGAGNDYILNAGANMFFQYGGGSDIVEGFNETSTLQIMAGSIDNALSNGTDAIFIIGADILTLKNLESIRTINVMDASGAVEAFTIPILIEGTEGVDDINNNVEDVTIKAYGGNDYINNSAASVTIDGGDGNVEIANSGENVSILGGKGNYTINNYSSNVTINAGAGNNSIFSNGDSVTIDSGDGKSYIDNRGDAVSISGGKGNYEIDNWASKVTINAGKGNDSVTLSNTPYDDGNIFIYTKGDGKDQISSFNENDTIKITDGSSVAANIDGEDVIFKIGTGSITVKDGAEDANGRKITLVDSDNNPLLAENIYATAGIITGETIKIAASYTDTYYQGDGITFVDASQVKKGIEITSMDTTGVFLGGKGKDTLSSSGDAFSLTGGKGNDVFVFGGGNATISDYSVKGINGADKVKLENLEETSYQIDSNNNLILTCGEGNKLTIEDGANKKITYTNNKKGVIYTAEGAFDGKRKSVILSPATTSFSAARYNKLATIDGAEATSAINILGNRKANYIVAGDNGSTLNGGKGKDSLFGGNGADLFVYEKSTGKDMIYYYGEGDRISLGSGVTIKDATIKRNNAVIKFKGGSMTVENATDLTFVGDGADTVFSSGVFLDTVAATAKVYGSFKDTISITDYENIKNVDASAGTKAVLINGDSESNSLIGGRAKDEIHGGDGADTIWGGKGNDSLWGETGNDTFVYRASEGNDIIMDYESGELLQILDKKGNANTFTSATFSGDALTLLIKGNGKVTFQSVNNETEFNINGDTYTVSGTTIAKK